MELTRRNFLSGAAVAAGAVGMGAFAATSVANADEAEAAEEAAEEYTYADTIAWNAEYDVVVVGFGCAGGTAAIYAADAGAQVLLCDAAPAGYEGGNSRVAYQMVMCGYDADMMYDYIRNGLYWKYDADEDYIRTYAEGLCSMGDKFAYLGVDDPLFWVENTVVSPEYPEYDGGTTVDEVMVNATPYNSALYKTVRNNVLDRADKIDVWYDAPAVHLIQEPENKTIVGVEIERGDETVYVRAVNGVVLACGGFENNNAMIQDYLGAPRLLPTGGLYNKGDGVRMGIEVGADLWHMDAYEVLGILGGVSWVGEDAERAYLEYDAEDGRLSLTSGEYAEGFGFIVGDDGSRYVDEVTMTRHGHVYSCGVWRMPPANYAPHYIFDQAMYDTLEANGRFEENGGRADTIVSASTPEELAVLIDADPEILAQTIADFNSFAENGRDIQFGRDADTMTAFSGDTYYAFQCRPCLINTQGGPRRNCNAEVLDAEGEPIPHLYSAGELGGICAFQYNSGGNLAECLIYGEIAGTNAAADKDELPSYTGAPKVDPDIKYVAGEASDEGDEFEIELGENEYLGSSTECMGDILRVKATVEDGVVTAIEVVTATETAEYGGRVIDGLVEAALEAGSADIDMVTGATMTSVAFIEALTAAIAQA